MSRKEPSNECYLAAELAAALPPAFAKYPSRAAWIAKDLCAIGRAYKRMAEKLCGGEEDWGRWSAAVEKAQERARIAQNKRVQKAKASVVGLPVKVYVSDLVLVCETKCIHRTTLL
jgi:hypothetical protein